MELVLKEIIQGINDFMLPLTRVTAMLMIVPGLGAQMVPVRIRVGLAVLITVLIFFNLPPAPAIPMFSPYMFVAIFQQFLIGFAIGFVMQLILQMVVVGAQLIAMQNGLGFASIVDPQSGSSIPLLSQFYLMMTTLLFFAMNGHLIVVETLAASFVSIPIGGDGLSRNGMWQIVLWGGTVFSAAVKMALPAIISLLLVNLGFGIMTRAAPQLNIFAVGFPVTLTLGMAIIYVTLGNVVPHVEMYMEESFLFLQTTVLVR